MAVTLVQTKGGNGGDYVENFDAVLTSNVTAGNTLILFVSEQNNGFTLSVSDNQGNTWVKINDGINEFVKGSLWYVANAAGGPTTVTLDWGSGNFQDFAYYIREYSGLDNAPLDVTAENLDADFVTSHPTGTTSTPTQANCLVVAAFAGDSNGTYTITGFTNKVNANHSDTFGSVTVAQKIITSAAAQSGTFSSGAVSMKGYGAIAVFKEPATAATISPADAALGLSADNATIAQNHVIASNDGLLSLSADNTTITQNHVLIPADLAISLTSDNATIAEQKVFPVQDLAFTLSADNATINQNHIIPVADLAFSLTADNVTILRIFVIAVQDLLFSLSSDNTTIAQNHVIATNDLAFSLSADNTTVDQSTLLSPNDLAFALTSDNTTLAQNHVIAVADLLFSTILDAATLNQSHVLTPSDLAFALSEDTTSLSTQLIITVQDLLLALGLDATTITSSEVLLINVAITGMKREDVSLSGINSGQSLDGNFNSIALEGSHQESSLAGSIEPDVTL